MADPSSESIGHAPIPRWVKVSGIIAIAVVLLLGIAMILGGGPGGHGPSRHAPPDAAVTAQRFAA